MDTAPDAALDRITALARLTFDTPIALISLVDDARQWFKSRQGLDVCETDRRHAFCAHALPLERGSVMVVEDAVRDPRFADNPLVTGEPGIRFYAGAVLTSLDGANLGTLCVIDTQPRPALTDLQRETLKALADLVMKELEVQRVQQADAAKRQILSLAEAMAGVGHWRLEVATGAAEWSQEVYRIHGLDPASFDPMLNSALDFYDEAGRAAVARHIEEAVRDRKGFSFQLRIRRQDGAWRDVICRATCEVDGDGEVRALVGVFQDVTEQQALLAQVREDGERYRLLTQNATDVIATYGPDGTFSYVSPAIKALLGRSPEDLVGSKTYILIDPQDHLRVTAEFGALLASGAASTRIEYRALHADGSSVWVEAHPRPIFDEGGRLTGFQDVVRDVSARRAAEDIAAEATRAAKRALASAQESEARYRLLAENANDMISTSTLDSTLLFVTPAIRRLLGYEPQEVIGLKTTALTHPEDLPRVIALFRGLVAAGPGDRVEPYQFRGRHKSGAWVWLEGQPRVQFDPHGEPLVFQDVVRDISERRRIEEEVREAAARAEEARAVATDSERRYRLLAENATDMITRCSLNDRIRFISPSCERILGYTAGELVGRRTIELIEPGDLGPLRAAYERLIAEGAGAPSVEMQFRVRRKDGALIWLEGRPKVIFNEAGRAREVYDIIRDVTARKAMEAELERAKTASEAAAQAKAEFLANMSHELRTPLTSIIGYTSLASEQSELAPVTRDYVRRVQNASRALLSTVNDVLDFSKLEAGEVVIRPLPTDVTAICRDAAELFTPQAAAKNLRVRLVGPPEPLPAVLIDAERLMQLLLNLIGNAVKFTDTGEVVVSAAYAEGRLRLAVQDTGPGIPPEAQARLFRRFSQVDGSSTRSHGGTGLGLAICKGLAERMGGGVSLRSRLGEGSTFTLDLPAAKAVTAPRDSDPPRRRDPPPRGAPRTRRRRPPGQP